ncbi:thiamine-phosphate kinase [Balneolaceae bacterium ANBcel3]|nr:thiamine-phosphate kinase [Balneolaceae bacterium ANBcel3]
MNKKSIAELGRAGLIETLSKELHLKRESVIAGIGDDAAVLEKNESHYTLISSETLVEGVAFDLAYTPFHQVGIKCVTAAVSDIYAMNGTPQAVLVNIALPNRVSLDMLMELYRGLNMASVDYNCQIAGGDTTGSHNALIISVTAYGEVEKEKITFVNGAKEDHALCVTGDLGSAYAGLKILLREKKHWEEASDPVMQPDLSEWEYVVKRQLLPVANKEMIEVFSEHKVVPGAMVDVSQGLIYDLKRMLKASKTGAYLYQAALPVDLETRKTADEMKDDVDNYALYGGEDFELLFTLPESHVDKLAKMNQNFSVIGRISTLDEGLQMQTAEGEVMTFEN